MILFLMNDDFFALKPIINWKKEFMFRLLEKLLCYGVRKNLVGNMVLIRSS